MIDKQELGISALKSLFSAIPFAGQPLNELFFDYRGRIRQERINDFSLLLHDYFDKNITSDFKDLNWVEFSDLFESVIIRVARTGSSAKHKRFRDILVNYFQRDEKDIDHTETFLENVSVLSEPAILVLKNHYIHDREFSLMDKNQKKLAAEIRRTENLFERLSADSLNKNQTEELISEIQKLKLELQIVQDQIKILEKYKQGRFNQLVDDDFLYLKQILLSRALLVDPGVGSTGHVPYRYMRITVFGKKFIEYILEVKKDKS